MKMIAILLFFILPISVWTDESVLRMSQEAEALWEARDYGAASSLYEQLLQRSLSPWQQVRILYNLGTIRIAQHEATDALDFFQKIVPTDLSLPQFGRDLMLNKGIAYLQYSQTLAIASASPSQDQQGLFIEQSLQNFDEAQILDCQVQQMEQEVSSSSCHPHALTDQWAKTARLLLHATHQQRRQNWMEQASTEMLASFLHNKLQGVINRINSFQNQDQPANTKASLIHYFQHQAESFIPVWNSMQQKEFTLSQKTSFDQAMNVYLNALQALSQQNSLSALKGLNQAIEALEPLTFKENIALQQAALNYNILLLQDPIPLSELQNLLAQFDQLEVDKDQTQSLEQIKENLQKSLKELEAKHALQARFFLLAGYSAIGPLLIAKETTSTRILNRALEQANRALQLFLSAELMSDESSNHSSIQSILKNQQQAVLTFAAPFIPTVLDEQNARFREPKSPSSGCQQSPWDQVIPLFDQGLQAARRADKQLNTPSYKPQDIVANQKLTIKNWQQALTLLLHPPKQNQSTPSNGESSSSASAPQNLSETFRLIQEMYLQDQSQPEQKTQELHSW